MSPKKLSLRLKARRVRNYNEYFSHKDDADLTATEIDEQPASQVRKFLGIEEK